MNIMGMKKGTKRITCIEGRCFANEYDASKFLLQLACEHRKVRIEHYELDD